MRARAMELIDALYDERERRYARSKAIFSAWPGFGLPSRAANCLVNHDIDSIDAFLALTRAQVLAWTAAGKKTADAIEAAQARLTRQQLAVDTGTET